MLQNFIVRRTRTSCFYLLPLPCYWVVVNILHLFHWRIRTSHYSLDCLCVMCFSVFISSTFVIEITRVDMNKPVDVLNWNIESISLFDMKGLGITPIQEHFFSFYSSYNGLEMLNFISTMCPENFRMITNQNQKAYGPWSI